LSGRQAHLRATAARLRGPAAVVLIVAGACLACWAGFVFARGMPAECGGDAPPCPPGSTAAFTGLMASGLVLLPLGVVLRGSRCPETAPAAIALAAAGAAAGVLGSRFVAAPITDATAATWWATAVLGGIAVVAGAIALLLVVLPDDDRAD
jgi:hypothetical protein